MTEPKKICQYCGGDKFKKVGFSSNGKQRWRCKNCKKAISNFQIKIIIKNPNPPRYWLGKKRSEETIAKIKEARAKQINQPCSEETKKKIGDAQRGEKNHRFGKKNSPYARMMISLKNKGRKGKSPSETSRQKIREARAKQIFPNFDTKIELKIQGFLTLLKMEYVAHKYISEIEHRYCCDIFIPVQEGVKQKTIIECDGDYWHGNPNIYRKEKLTEKQIKQIFRDESRTKELEKKGYRVIRLWESDIKVMEINNFKEKINL
jgi:G:T-mismatch repair DNA endonuclease (very short patch repair protein)